MVRSLETPAHDVFEPGDSVGCVAALFPRAKSWFHTTSKKEQAISNSKAAGDNAGDLPCSPERDNVGIKFEEIKGRGVEEVKILTPGDVRDEMRRRFMAAHNRLPRQSSCAGVAFAPARQDTERASEQDARDMTRQCSLPANPRMQDVQLLQMALTSEDPGNPPAE